MQTDDSLQVLASAVTPVVLVSATAILISGINSRYIAIADRIRTLTAEYRNSGTNAARRASIAKQLPGFQCRVKLVSSSMLGLYFATGCFVAMALIISATVWRKMLVSATLPLFIMGIVMLIFSIVCELLELRVANSTLFAEISDLEPR